MIDIYYNVGPIEQLSVNNPDYYWQVNLDLATAYPARCLYPIVRRWCEEIHVLLNLICCVFSPVSWRISRYRSGALPDVWFRLNKSRIYVVFSIGSFYSPISRTSVRKIYFLCLPTSIRSWWFQIFSRFSFYYEFVKRQSWKAVSKLTLRTILELIVERDAMLCILVQLLRTWLWLDTKPFWHS